MRDKLSNYDNLHYGLTKELKFSAMQFLILPRKVLLWPNIITEKIENQIFKNVFLLKLFYIVQKKKVTSFVEKTKAIEKSTDWYTTSNHSKPMKTIFREIKYKLTTYVNKNLG